MKNASSKTIQKDSFSINGDTAILIYSGEKWQIPNAYGMDINYFLEYLEVDRWSADYHNIANIIDDADLSNNNNSVVFTDNSDKSLKEASEAFELKIGGYSYMSMLMDGDQVFKSNSIKLLEDGNYWLFASKIENRKDEEINIDGKVIAQDIVSICGCRYAFLLTYKNGCTQAWRNSYKEVVESSKGEYRIYGTGNDIDIRRYTQTIKNVLWRK